MSLTEPSDPPERAITVTLAPSLTDGAMRWQSPPILRPYSADATAQTR